MSIKKILVALIIAFAVVGLTGGASASLLDSYYPNFGSYAHTSIDYFSPAESISVDYFGTHVSDFSTSDITTHTDVTVYQSPSIFDSYTSSYTPSHSPSPSVFETSTASEYLGVSYFGVYNGETISGSIIDLTVPFCIAESIPFGRGTFSFSSFANNWP